MRLFFAILLLVSTPASAGILDIQTVKSAKGISAWLVEDHSVPVISVRFTFVGAGAVNDPDAKQGLSQILSNTLDEGAGDMDSKAFQGALNDHSISLGFSSSRDDFGGSVKTLSKHQDKAFDLLALALTQPRFDKEAVARMIESNLTRIRSNMTDPEWMNARLTNSVIFDGHPYAMNTGGTLSSLPRVTPDDLRAKFKTQLGQDNLMVSVAGDITKDQLAIMLDKVFGQIPEKSKVIQVADIKISDVPSETLYRQDIPQTVINMTLAGIGQDDPDYHVAEILDFVLGSSGFGSRLTEEIREKRGLTYGIYSNLSNMDHANVLSIGVSTKNESVGQVIDLTKEVMSGLAMAPISSQELKDAKTYLVGSVPLQLTSTDRISGAMMSLQRLHLPADYFDNRQVALGRVTAEDVLRVGRRLLQAQSLKIVLVGNPKIGDTVQTVSVLPNVE